MIMYNKRGHKLNSGNAEVMDTIAHFQKTSRNNWLHVSSQNNAALKTYRSIQSPFKCNCKMEAIL